MGSGIVDYSKNYLGNEYIQLIQVKAADKSGRVRTLFLQSEEIDIHITFTCHKKIKGLRFNLRVKTSQQEDVFLTTSHEITKSGISPGEYTLKLTIPKYLLNKKRYLLAVNAGIPGKEIVIEPIDTLFIDIEGENAGGSSFNEIWPGLVSPKIDWEYL